MDLFRKLLWFSLSSILLLWLKNIWKVYDTTPSLKTPTVSQSQPMKEVERQSDPQPSVSFEPLVRFTTDIFEGVISPQGDLVQLKLLNYARDATTKDTRSLVLLDSSNVSDVTAQTTLISADSNTQEITYQSAQEVYVLSAQQDVMKIHLHAHVQGVNITKIFTIQRGNYQIHVDYHIKNKRQNNWHGKLCAQLTQYKNADTQREAAFSTQDQPYQKGTFAKIEKKTLPKFVTQGWIGLVEPYFTIVWIPHFGTYSVYAQQKDLQHQFGLLSSNYTVEPEQHTTLSLSLYAGPKILENLQSAAAYLDQTIDYGICGFISHWIFWILKHLYAVLGNWGWSVVLTAALFRILLYPLSAQEMRDTLTKQRLQPRIQALKENYPENPMGFRIAQNALYRSQGVRSWVSVVSLVFAIPTFIAWSGLFRDNAILFQQPFILWIQDLASKDPYYILPLLLGVMNFIEQRFTPMMSNVDATPDPMMQNIMLLIPFVMPLFIRNFPSGVLLVWLVQTILSVIQKVWIVRKHSI